MDDAMSEQITRVQAIKEVQRMHGIDRKTAAALVDEMIRLQTKPVGLYRNGCPMLEETKWQS